MVVSSQFHDEVQLKNPSTLLEVFLRHFSYCCRKVFHDDGFDKINELFNFKWNFVSRFKNLRDNATELGLLNNNGILNVQFN